MSITIPCWAVTGVTHGPGPRLSIELDMDQHQMLAALKSFLSHGISDETWSAWQADINHEIYGETP